MRLSADMKGDLRTRITHIIQTQTGMFEHLSLPIADEILKVVIREFRGDRVYCTEPRDDVRDQVREAFTGRNRDEVMRRFGISRATFYRYLRD